MRFIQIIAGLVASSPLIILATPTPAPLVIMGGISEDKLDNTTAPSPGLEVRAPIEKRSYINSCGSCQLGPIDYLPDLLECRCTKANGNVIWTHLTLSLCIRNTNGALYWGAYGGFHGSCDKYTYGLSGTGGKIFSAACRNNALTWGHWSSINLDERIHNYDGVLGCDV